MAVLSVERPSAMTMMTFGTEIKQSPTARLAPVLCSIFSYNIIVHPSYSITSTKFLA